MAINGGQHIHLVGLDGRVLTTGGSLNVTDGVLAIVNNKKVTQNGRQVVSNFKGQPKNSDFQILLGKSNKTVTKSTNNKPWETLPFKLSEVVSLEVVAPKQVGQKVDDIIIGYNGKAGTELTIGEHTASEIEVVLSGDAMHHLGYADGKVVLKLMLESPYLDEEGAPTDYATTSMQEIVEKAVERFNNMTLLGGAPVTDYVDAMVVNSLAPQPTATTSFTFYTLTLNDQGDSSALARVQAQYPTQKVVRTETGGDRTVYTILATTGTTLPAFTTSTSQLLKGCEDCPAGYDEIEAGVVYSVEMEDDGANSSALVQALPGAVAASAVKVGQKYGIGSYTVVLDNSLTEAEIATFVGTAGVQSTAVITELGEVNAVCENDTVVTTAWVAGDVCEATTKTFKITLADDECGDSRLAELQEAYPDLTITEDTVQVPALCQTTYTTNITTNVLCDECSDEFKGLFTAEAPRNYGVNSWSGADATYDVAAKMGIRFRGKEFILSGGEQFRDDMPFYYTSTRLSVSGGQPKYISESWNSTAKPFAVKVLSIAAEPEGLGAYLQEKEDQSRFYFDGIARFEGNNYGKWLWGQETRLKPLGQYVEVQLTIDVRKHFYLLPHASELITYHFPLEIGQHQDLENLFNSLAAAAGISPIQALAK